MPVVIDLLSSPELPRPNKVNKGPKSSKPAPAIATKALTSTNALDDGWFNLSSDGIDALPPPKPVTLKPSTTYTKPASKPTGGPKPLAGLNTSKGGNDFCFLSDDFDSTVNLDDPFASDPPPPKKQRLSPPPKATSSKNAEPKMIYNRSLSIIESSSKSNTSRTTRAPSLKRSKTISTILESDPIIFTSSPDPFEDVARRKKEKRKQTWEDEDEDIFDLGKPGKIKASGCRVLEDEDEDTLDIGNGNGRSGKNRAYESGILESTHGNRRIAFAIDDSSDIDLPDILSLTSNITKSKPRKSSQSALAKYNADKAKEKAAKEKAEKVKEKAASKGAEKEKKRTAKEGKIKEKEKAAEVAKVNTLRTDKKISTPEMIVDLPSCFDPKLTEKVQTFLSGLEVEHSDWQSTLPVVKWRRKVASQWNEEIGHWEPIPRRIRIEKHVMCVISAKEFVELVLGDEGRNLDSYVLRLKAKFEACEVMYMIEGLMPWMRKNRNFKNRQFTEAVRSHLSQEEPAAPTASQRTKKKKKEQEYVDEDLIENALLRLQVIHGALIHHTNAMIETAEWIVTFTQHISTVPYR